MVLALAISPAANAGPKLGIGESVGGTVVRFDPDDLTFPDRHPEKAPAAAIVGRASGPDDAEGRVLGPGGKGGYGGRRVAGRSGGVKKRSERREGESRRPEERAPFQKTAPGQHLFILPILPVDFHF